MATDTSRRLVLAAGDGLQCGLIVTAVVYDSAGFLAEAVVGPGFLPPALSVWLTCSLALALGLLGWRLSVPAPCPGQSRALARSAGCGLFTTTGALAVGCGWGLCPIGIAAFFGIGFALAFGLVWAGLHGRHCQRRALVVVLCVFLILSLPLTLWPARMTTGLSRRALDVLADRVERGHVVRRPVRAGVLLIHATELRGTTPFLVTSPRPSGAGGLARCGPNAAKRRFNLWSAFALSPTWQLIFED